MSDKQVAVIVGSGFSSALTSGKSPILGSKSLPTLNGLSADLLAHMEQLNATKASLPFMPDVFNDAISALRRNVVRAELERYNFEEFLSLLAIGSTLSRASHSPALSRLAGANPEVLRCFLYSIADFFTSNLSYDGKTAVNRNFWYKVNDADRALSMKAGIWQLADQYQTTIISFNYDGIIEAFLDWWLGQKDQQRRGFRYLVELSHAIPLTMPEHVYFRRDTRDLSRLPRLPIVLKPHGSIHFFQLREELRGLMSGPTLAAVHPRLDIGFNPATGQRDIPDAQFWEFADRTPLIIPPLLNKDSFFGNSYFQAMLRLIVEAVQRAEYVLVIGFSLPSSDLHVSAAFETINWSGKKLGLAFRAGAGDGTQARWKRVAGDAATTLLTQDGIPVDSVADINEFWESVVQFLD